jgi:hypothetical protein
LLTLWLIEKTIGKKNMPLLIASTACLRPVVPYACEIPKKKMSRNHADGPAKRAVAHQTIDLCPLQLDGRIFFWLKK